MMHHVPMAPERSLPNWEMSLQLGYWLVLDAACAAGSACAGDPRTSRTVWASLEHTFGARAAHAAPRD